MGQQASSSGGQAAKGKHDTWVKLGFLAAALVIAAVVYIFLQTEKPILPDTWSKDLAGTVRRARGEGRRLLVFFMGNPPGQTARNLARKTLRKDHNRRAVQAGKFLLVQVALDRSLKSDTARRYRIRKLPTMLLLDPNGRELNRREGFIGEVEFREGFLDGTRIVKPEGAAAP